MPLLKDHIIDQIKETAEIVEVGQQLGLDLKKSGTNFKCLSPWASEKTPSCVLSPVKNIFKDFSSGKGGGPVQLVKEVKGIEWLDSIKFLADMYHIELQFEEESEEQAEKRASLVELQKLMEASMGYYQSELKNLDDSHPAKIYVNSRFTQAEVIEWKIGYAPESWDFIKKKLVERALLDAGIDAGLIIKKSASKTFDFYRDRVMFPIINHRGQVVSFNGRTYEGSTSDKPKYLNGPDTPIFKKSNVLIGLDRAIGSRSNDRSVCLVEGPTDVIAMHSGDFTRTVGTCGTSFTPEHIKLLKKYGFSDLVFIGDGDKAGRKALEKNIVSVLSADIRASVIPLPDGQDPYSFLRSKEPKVKPVLQEANLTTT